MQAVSLICVILFTHSEGNMQNQEKEMGSKKANIWEVDQSSIICSAWPCLGSVESAYKGIPFADLCCYQCPILCPKNFMQFFLVCHITCNLCPNGGPARALAS